MELKNYFAQDAQGNAISGATCYLYEPGTTTLASGLENAEGAPLANPFSSATDGLVQFAAPNGRYDLRILSGTRDYTVRVQCADVGAILDDVQAAAEVAQDAKDYVDAAVSGPFLFLDNAVTENFAIPLGKNALVIAPTIQSGVEITVPTGSTLVVLDENMGGGGGGGGGEVNTASNIGAGVGVFQQKTGANFEFRSLVAGAGIAVSQDGAGGVVIANTRAAGEANTGANLGSGAAVFSGKVGTELQFRSLIAGANVALSQDGNSITISSSGEATTAANIGTGTGALYKQKVGSQLQMKTLKAGTNVTITNNADDVTISAAAAGGEVNTGQSLGGSALYAGKTGVTLQFRGLLAGQGVALSTETNTLTLRTVYISSSDPGAVGAGVIWVTP